MIYFVVQIKAFYKNPFNWRTIRRLSLVKKTKSISAMAVIINYTNKYVPVEALEIYFIRFYLAS